MENFEQTKTPVTNGSAPADTDCATNGSAPAYTATSTNATADTIPWDDAVAEGKEINVRLKAAERDQLRLGELAHKVVHPIYRENTFAKFAAELGIDEDTLGHYRTTYRAWKDIDLKAILPPGAKLPSFAALRELAPLPNRAELIKAEPNMSKRRAEVHRVLKNHPKILSAYPELSDASAARKLIGGAKRTKNGAKKPEDLRNIEGWYREQVAAVNAVINELNKQMEKCKPEQLATLDPTLLSDASQKLAEKSAEFEDWVNTPLEKAADALSQKGNRTVVTPDPNASRPIQPPEKT
jgi:hypothetical protein